MSFRARLTSPSDEAEKSGEFSVSLFHFQLQRQAASREVLRMAFSCAPSAENDCLSPPQNLEIHPARGLQEAERGAERASYSAFAEGELYL